MIKTAVMGLLCPRSPNQGVVINQLSRHYQEIDTYRSIFAFQFSKELKQLISLFHSVRKHTRLTIAKLYRLITLSQQN